MPLASPAREARPLPLRRASKRFSYVLSKDGPSVARISSVTGLSGARIILFMSFLTSGSEG